MLKLNPLNAALLFALCGNTFAQTQSVSQGDLDTDAQLLAGAVHPSSTPNDASC